MEQESWKLECQFNKERITQCNVFDSLAYLVHELRTLNARIKNSCGQ